MDDDQSRLIDLAGAVADGDHIDWRTAHANCAPEEQRPLTDLAFIAAIAAGARQDERPEMLPPDSQWGPLRVLEPVGSGRQGTVFRAWDPELERTVALKLLDGDAAHTVTEGRLMARVHHPNVVSIFGAQQIDGRTGLWMEFIDGPPLEHALATSGPFAAANLIAVASAVCAALAAIHAKGLVHRDVKTTNILRDSGGRIVLGDFGTTGAHGGHGGHGGHGDGMFAGTPRYMAPELFDGEPPSPRSDIYSLGVVLYRLATGSYPHEAGSLSELRRAVKAPAPSVSTRRSDLPPSLCGCIDTALQAHPSRRFASAAEMLRILSGESRGTSPWLRQAVAVAAALIVVAAVSAGWIIDREPVPRTESTRKLASGPAIDGSGTPSADGRWLTFVESTTGNLAIQELATGTTRTLTDSTGWLRPGDYASTSRLSPDARRVAYTWWSESLREMQLRVIAAGGGTPRVLLRRGRMAVTPSAWSADGRSIIVVLGNPGAAEIGEIDSSSGEYRTISSLATIPAHVQPSPDGQSLAFDVPSGQGHDHDIRVIDRAGGGTIFELADEADDRFPLWSSGNRRLLFLSDRDRTESIWSVRPEPNESAVIVKRDVGDIAPLTLTAEGALYYTQSSKPLQNLYEATLHDLSAVSEPRMIGDRFIDSSAGPAWSPDGRVLAFYSLAPDPQLVLRSATDERTLPLPPGTASPFFAGPRWFPDSRSLLLHVRPPDDSPAGFVKLEASTGTTTMVHQGTLTRAVSSFALAPDGSAIFWTVQGTNNGREPSGKLLRFDLRTRQQIEMGHNRWFISVAVSPDSRQLGYFTTERGEHGEYPGVVSVMPAAGGPSREVFRDRIWMQGGRYNTLAWTSDQRALMFVRDDGQLWRVSVSGGDPERMGVSAPGRIKSPSMHPTKPLLTFGVAQTDRNELWRLENFLRDSR